MIKKITLLLMLIPFFGFGQLATWNFFGATQVPTWDVATIDANLVQTATLTRGAGAPESTGGNSFRTVGFQNDGIDVTNTDYFQFELTPLTGFKMSLSSIDGQVKGTASFATNNGNAGVENQFAYSLDGTTFTLIGAPELITTGNSALPTIDLSGITALQNIAAGTTVTFRFYASGQTTTGGWGFTSASATTENLVIGGTSAAVSGGCTVIAAPTSSDTTICSGAIAILPANSLETGSILTWYNVPTGGTSIATGSIFTTPALTATTSYWIQDSLSGCPASARTEVIVTVSGIAPTVTATSNSPVCAGSTLNLSASTAVGASYAWTGPNSFTSSLQNPSISSVTTLAAGTYNLTATSGGCTSAVSSITVVVNANPTVVSTPSYPTICAGSNVALNASGANTYTWSPATGLSSTTGNTITANPTATTTYTVTGSDANGCVGTNIVIVTVNSLPVVTLTASGMTLTATSFVDASYKWFTCPEDSLIGVSTSNTYIATENGSYKVEVTDTNGCVATSNCINITTVGLETKSNLNSFNISPNPTKGKLTITASGSETASVVIYNALGKEVSKVGNIQNGSVIDFSAFNNGVYMVQFTNSKGTKVQRVVKN